MVFTRRSTIGPSDSSTIFLHFFVVNHLIQVSSFLYFCYNELSCNLMNCSHSITETTIPTRFFFQYYKKCPFFVFGTNFQGQKSIQWNLDLVTLLVSPKTVTKSRVVTKFIAPAYLFNLLKVKDNGVLSTIMIHPHKVEPCSY